MSPSRLFYRISEVAAMLGVSAFTLRYWESCFEQLRPTRTPAGARQYRARDIELCKLIKHFHHEKGYSIEYTKKMLAGYEATPQLHKPDKCHSARGAIRLLSEVLRRTSDDSARIRINYVLEWLRSDQRHD